MWVSNASYPQMLSGGKGSDPHDVDENESDPNVPDVNMLDDSVPGVHVLGVNLAMLPVCSVVILMANVHRQSSCGCDNKTTHCRKESTGKCKKLNLFVKTYYFI